MERRERRWDDPSASFAEDFRDPSISAARGYLPDDDAVASVIAHASRLIASSLAPVGRGLAFGGEGTAQGCADLVLAAIQIDAVTALFRRLARPRACGVSFESHCRTLGCDLVLALGRLDVTPQVAMYEPPLSPARSFRLAILVVELMADAIRRDPWSGDGGTIWVMLEPAREGQLELTVADSFAPTLAPAPACGARVEALVDALGGELIQASGSIGIVRVRFPAG
jgi:hypothetical protein